MGSCGRHCERVRRELVVAVKSVRMLVIVVEGQRLAIRRRQSEVADMMR